MTPDWLLLRQYARENSQAAFAALTARYLNLVYSVCLREVQDAEMAQDATQAVFLLLARTAPHFRSKTALPGWLFRTARFAAQNARTREQRRRYYEGKAAQAMQQQNEGTTDAAWEEIEPSLNQSLAVLREGERECILLRYFQEMNFSEIGTALGLSEEAARKRVTRALEKMRRFFGTEGVIIPGAALAALLSTHAAKAAPATCSEGIATITTGVLVGHLPLSLTGLYVHQLSDGALKVMKISQLKIAIGIAAVAIIGFTTYTVAKGITPVVTAGHKITSLFTAPKPGHVLAQPPGQSLTAAQIATRCREAYTALKSYQGTTTVTTESVTAADPASREYHTSATIQFVRPGRIRAEGTDMSGGTFAYVSDGAATVETNPALKGVWRKDRNTEMAVASVTGIALSAATTVPALLLGTNWGNPFPTENVLDSEVREDKVDGNPCYVVTSSPIPGASTRMAAFWVDEKTFLLRRYVLDTDTPATSFVIAGSKHDIPATKSHDDQRFTNERLNQAIPDSTFMLPTSQ